ncbi:FecR family protein [Oleiharenicola lentus]|uniref:FecR family protein n=1 Tax=Oleiharenicola lentus TaxID=2508720 RepID=UPI003F67A1C5
MKSSPRITLAAKERASLWAARLDGSVLSTEDRTELNTWLDSHPSHRPLLSSYCQFSADLEQQLPLIEGIKELSAESYKTAQPTPWLRRPIWAGAVLTMAAAVALAFWVNQPSHQSTNLASSISQRQQIVLVDGTEVELNARTSLQVAIDGKSRHIRLADGEAFFSVHKDPSRPFIVETPAGSVRVTGTKFNVRTEPNAPWEITVLEGSVQAQPHEAAHSETLTKGEKLSADTSGVTVQALSDSQLQDTLAWRQGQIVFYRTPLREALARFARYHGRNFTATEDAADLKVGGRFSLDDPEGFFSGIQEMMPMLRVTRTANGSAAVSVSDSR